jgi:hypothetical protein
VDNLVELPLVLESEAENSACGSGELTVPDSHQNQRAVLETLVVDPDAHFSFRGLCKGVGILDVPNLQNLQGKRATHLSVGVWRNYLDIVAKLKIAALLGQPAQRPRVTHGSDGPKIVLSATFHL